MSFWILLGIVIVAVFVWCLCATASNEDDETERFNELMKKYQQKHFDNSHDEEDKV